MVALFINLVCCESQLFQRKASPPEVESSRVVESSPDETTRLACPEPLLCSCSLVFKNPSEQVKIRSDGIHYGLTGYMEQPRVRYETEELDPELLLRLEQLELSALQAADEQLGRSQQLLEEDNTVMNLYIYICIYIYVYIYI